MTCEVYYHWITNFVLLVLLPLNHYLPGRVDRPLVHDQPGVLQDHLTAQPPVHVHLQQTPDQVLGLAADSDPVPAVHGTEPATEDPLEVRAVTEGIRH